MNNSLKLNLLIVDDDLLVHQSFRLSLPENWKIHSATSAEEVPDQSFHLAFVDMHLQVPSKEATGLKVIQKLSHDWPQLQIVAMSGDVERILMEQSLKAGAQRFIAKPLNPEEVDLILKKAEANWELLNQSMDSRYLTPWIGNSDASMKIKKTLADLRGENSSILILGETGTGKEVAAQLLHHQEGQRPWVTMNMAAIPENLFESELFGHQKGAFTGADTNKVGLLEASQGGDVFLDEIQALPLHLQVKLLRFLESGEIRRVGAKDSFKVSTRVIAASNEDLQKRVKEGSFRQDLLFRLSGQVLKLPPLRERKDDIPVLADFFLQQERPRRNKNFSQDGVEALMEYNWPGNVRELKRVCEQLSLMSPLPFIRREDVEALIFPQRLKQNGAKTQRIESQELEKGLDQLIHDYEKNLLQSALQYWPHPEEAAQKIKISRSRIYKKINEYNLDGE